MYWLEIYIDIEMFVRLFIATILGLLIGLEREIKRKSLGLRTILVISIVSCLLTIVSIQSSYLFPETNFAEIRMDPLRLAAQIVSGVGFLGAGVILRREDDTVTGLTTAAIVWGAAGIGITTGAGFYLEAIGGVALLLVSLKLIPVAVNRFNYSKLHLVEYYVKVLVDSQDEIEEVIQSIKKEASDTEDLKIKDLKDGTHRISMKIIVYDNLSAEKVYNYVTEIDHIVRTEISS